MIAKGVVIVTGEKREDKPTAQFAEVIGNIIAESADAVGHNREACQSTISCVASTIWRLAWAGCPVISFSQIMAPGRKAGGKERSPGRSTRGSFRREKTTHEAEQKE